MKKSLIPWFFLLTSCLSIPSRPEDPEALSPDLEVKTSRIYLEWNPSRTGNLTLPVEFTLTARTPGMVITRRQSTWVDADGQTLIPPAPQIPNPQVLNPGVPWTCLTETSLEHIPLFQAADRDAGLDSWIYLKQTFFYETPQGPGQVTLRVPTFLSEQGLYNCRGIPWVETQFFRYHVQRELLEDPGKFQILKNFQDQADRICSQVFQELGNPPVSEKPLLVVNQFNAPLFGGVVGGFTNPGLDSQGNFNSSGRICLNFDILDPPWWDRVWAPDLVKSFPPHVLAHELTHWMTLRALPWTPSWLQEGAAEWMAAKITRRLGVAGYADHRLTSRYSDLRTRVRQENLHFLFDENEPVDLKIQAYDYYTLAGFDFFTDLEAAFGSQAFPNFFRKAQETWTFDGSWFQDSDPWRRMEHNRVQSRQSVEILFKTLGPQSRDFLIQRGVPDAWIP